MLSLPAMTRIFVLLVTLLSLHTPSLAVVERTNTGFYYPLGASTFAPTCGKWLGRDSANGGCYFSGLYHIGFDMMAPQGTSVYAIANGTVLDVHYSDASWGVGNAGVFVEHFTGDGQRFVALYGHVRLSGSTPSQVTAGVAFATLGPYPEGGDHLHFGIYVGSGMPSSPWGRLPNENWGDAKKQTKGFVDPVAFIRKNYPFGATACNSQPTACIATTYCPAIGPSGRGGGDFIPCSIASAGSGGSTLPDFFPRRVYLTGNKIYLHPGETFTIYTTVKNSGANAVNDVKVRYNRSKGLKIDKPSDYVTLGTTNIRYYNLPSGGSKDESLTVTAPTALGVYNIVVRIDPRDRNPESNEDNNDSDELVFEVVRRTPEERAKFLRLMDQIIND